MCNRIVALMHGTTDLYLKSILENNRIEAKKSSMGLNVAVSTYPILDCDMGHLFNLFDFWGTCKIFIKPSLLSDKTDWQLSVESDVAADWRKMPYNHTNVHEYMPVISQNRSAIYLNQHETDMVKLYGGELAFKSTLEKIKNYILFVTIDDTKPELIQYVMNQGINVIIIHNNILQLDPEWFDMSDKLMIEQNKLRQLLPTLYIRAQQRREKQSIERQISAQKQREQYEFSRTLWENIVREYGPDKLQRILGMAYGAIQRAYDTNDHSLTFRVARAEKKLEEHETRLHPK